jgi:predicted lipoprotein with Yx(FWY)xxD motif
VKRLRVVWLAMVLAGLALSACSSDSKSSTTAGASSAGSSATTTTSPTTTTVASTTTAATSTASLGVAMNAKLGKQIIVDAKGMTVYLYDPDGASTTTKVPDAIKANWPPVVAAGAPGVGAGLDQAKVAAQMQADGTSQVSYDGHLLYTFVGDKAPGDVVGQGLGGVWFVLSPDGTKLPA